MTAAEIKQYFNYHNENIKLLKTGYDEMRQQLKATYKTRNTGGNFIYSFPEGHPQLNQCRKKELALSRILAGIQVSWAEESIKRLVYEPDLFTEGQRDCLIAPTELLQRWYNSLHIVFCIAYDLVPAGDEICSGVNIRHQRRNLGPELVDQYFTLRKIITDYLTPNFKIRNKVQHGEWAYAFNANVKTFSADLTHQINHENIVTTTSRYTLVNSLYQMLVDLARFKSNNFALNPMLTPFEYFYPNYIRKISYETTKIAVPELRLFIKEIIEREIRGEAYRRRL